AKLVDRAAMLSKADTATDMVYELPEQRGVMGRE
ncbi:MAG TPA: glycine--tRNA ligase subunit beta, partial [Synergistetes bacterium]|nr:glycine--tRNA ligase subunit beta [Synergistota bacterium]